MLIYIEWVKELLHIMRQLRAPDGGCPWDQQQTHLSLRPYLLEEAAEAVDALSNGDSAENSAEICSELGDVLLQIAFHSVIAEEQGSFSYDDIERSIVDKMIRRHPHVFAEPENRPTVQTTEQLAQIWQQVKRQEQTQQQRAEQQTSSKPPRPLRKQIPSSLGALAREDKAQKLRSQHSQHNQKDPHTREPTDNQLLDHLKNLQQRFNSDERANPDELELLELEVGQLFASLVAWARSQGIDAENALRRYTNQQLDQLDQLDRPDQPEQLEQ